MRSRLFPAFVWLVCCVLGLFACEKDQNTPEYQGSSDTVVNLPLFVVDENGQMPSNDSDLLYESRLGNPVLAPDGHQLNWAEFAAVRGNIEVICEDEGTSADLQLSGLIPNGVYTFWNVQVQSPGFNPGIEGFNITGIGASGKGDGSDNSIVASADGRANIKLLSPGGPMSVFGEIGSCFLSDEFEFHIVGLYHIDGQTYGPQLGPDGTMTEQFGFVFVNGN